MLVGLARNRLAAQELRMPAGLAQNRLAAQELHVPAGLARSRLAAQELRAVVRALRTPWPTAGKALRVLMEARPITTRAGT